MLKLNLSLLIKFLGIKHVKQCLVFVFIMLYIYYYDTVIIKGLYGFPFELGEIITMTIIIKIFFLIPMQYVDFMVLKRFLCL